MVVCSMCLQQESFHDPDCPQETEVWPIIHEDLLSGLTCMDCGEAFSAGEYYTRRAATADRWDLDEGIEIPVREIVCLGCAALSYVA